MTKKAKAETKKTLSTHIVMIVDRSGSMTSVADGVIEGINGFIAEQKKIPGSCKLTLIQFDTIDPCQILINNKELSEVPDNFLTKEVYVPRGGTPLLDVIGKAINNTDGKLALAETKPDRVIFVIHTDGQENSSQQYTIDTIRGLIKARTDNDKWSFVFLGEGLDAINSAHSLGLSSADTLAMVKTANAYGVAYRSTSNCVANLRCSVDAKVEFSEADRKDAMK